MAPPELEPRSAQAEAQRVPPEDPGGCWAAALGSSPTQFPKAVPETCLPQPRNEPAWLLPLQLCRLLHALSEWLVSLPASNLKGPMVSGGLSGSPSASGSQRDLPRSHSDQRNTDLALVYQFHCPGSCTQRPQDTPLSPRLLGKTWELLGVGPACLFCRGSG